MPQHSAPLSPSGSRAAAPAACDASGEEAPHVDATVAKAHFEKAVEAAAQLADLTAHARFGLAAAAAVAGEWEATAL